MIDKIRNRFHRHVTPRLRRLGVPVTRNDRKLWQLKNRHKGQRAFIIGNGPSVKMEYLEQLRGEVTFAMNQMYKCFEQTSWRPTYYVLSDSLVAENYGKPILDAYNGRVLVTDHIEPVLGKQPRITVYPKTHECYEDEEPEFSSNALVNIIGGYTTSYICFQIAWYMGIRDIVTLGLDANYSFSGAENAGSLGVYEKVANAPASNWFLPGYFEKGTVLLKPKVKQQVLAYRAARRFIEGHGGKVRNAGWQSPLDVFERVAFDSLF